MSLKKYTTEIMLMSNSGGPTQQHLFKITPYLAIYFLTTLLIILGFILFGQLNIHKGIKLEHGYRIQHMHTPTLAVLDVICLVYY